MLNEYDSFPRRTVRTVGCLFMVSEEGMQASWELRNQAAEFSLECESDMVVAIRIRKTGQTYIFDSSSQEEWLEALPRLVLYPP